MPKQWKKLTRPFAALHLCFSAFKESRQIGNIRGQPLTVDIFAQVRAAINEFVEVDPDEITLESRFKEDLGADSLDQVEMVMCLETQGHKGAEQI